MAWFDTWTKDAGNPLIPSGATFGSNPQDAELVKVGTTYYLFYMAAGYLKVCSTSEASYPYGWGNVATVLSPGGQGIDSTLVSAPVPLKMQDGSWRLYYHSYDGSYERMCFATCSAANFPAGPWTKYAGNPVMDKAASGQWDDGSIHPEVVIPPWAMPERGINQSTPDGKWHCFYGGHPGAVDMPTYNNNWKGGHATSMDGISWTRDASSPVLLPGSGWESVSVHPTAITCKGGVYYMLYQAFNGTTWETGYATSSTLAAGSWSKAAANPVLTRGAAGSWESASAENPGIVYEPARNILDLWYVAGSSINSVYAIGLARGDANAGSAPDPLTVDRSDAATLSASSDAAYAAAGRLTVSAGQVVGGKVTLSGHRVPGSVVYVSR